MTLQSAGADASLSDAEREILLLLAQGHTAKSIATELRMSVHVVHERLREARRKTGAASSRELARELAAQKDWDQNIGVSPSDVPDEQDGSRAHASRWRRPKRKELVAMGFAVLSAVGIIAACLQASGSTLDLQSLALGSPDTAAMYNELRTGEPDRSSAPTAERSLVALYSPLSELRSVEARCNARICEVSGAIESSKTAAAGRSLQDERLEQSVRSAGFDRRLGIAFADAARGGQGQFVLYWRRSS